MSFIKNIYNKFLSNQEEEDVEVEDTPYKSHLLSTSHAKKETEARVAYEYPKGNFRFPLIPDNRIAKTEESKVRNENRNRRNPVNEIKQEPAQKERQVKKVRPFTPTEIPSPVFGYLNQKKDKPEKPVVEEPIVYELNGFLDVEEYISPESPIHIKVPGNAPVRESLLAEEENLNSILPADERFNVNNQDDAVRNNGTAFMDVAPVSDEGINPKITKGLTGEETTIPSVIELADQILEEQEDTNSVSGTNTQVIAETLEVVDETPILTHLEVEVSNETESGITVAETADIQVVADTLEVVDNAHVLTEPKVEVSNEAEAAKSISETANIQGIANALEVVDESPALIQVSTDTEAAINVSEAGDLQVVPDTLETDHETKAVTQHEVEDSNDIEAERTVSEAPDIQVMAETLEDVRDTGTDLEVEEEIETEGLQEPVHPPAPIVEPDILPPQKTEPEQNYVKGDSLPIDGKEAAQLVKEEHKKEEDRPKRRSHLPFNVLMLKDDKRKLEQQKTAANRSMLNKVPAKPESTSTTNPPDNDEYGDVYSFPGANLLDPPVHADGDPAWLDSRRRMLEETLHNFNVGAKVVNVTQGPSVTRFEVHPEPGVKVNKVTNLSDDIKLSLAARDIRIEAPIPGKHTIGIEVPNSTSRPVMIREIIDSSVFKENQSPLTAVLGLDISGKPIVTDLKKMPHGLIAGSTGSGKSVCINSILVSLLYKASPDDLRLLLIDPKMVELAPYNRIPHLVSPVITDVKAATASLKWAVEEMERRYELFAHAGVREITRYNDLAMKTKRYSDKLPFIVIVIDELADLMMMAPADVEEAICRIAQKARACGIHLIIATQRPSVDVITGLIKANVPTRIAFSVSSQIDSRTIIDMAGAEKLLGRGDMLFLENGSSKPVRLQGTFVTDDEIDKVADFTREQRSPNYLFEQEELLKKAQVTEEEDELFFEACEFVVEQGGASTSSLQRRFKVGYNRAARLIDMMEESGYISGARGSKPRDVLITEAELESIHEIGRR
ncbi:DNA translocase FtsK [Bacillus sp. EB01]|uniref:DNA translocase FtsK n=1 Tax=Bacillus sp. EB01 TaxID=1347086 RepID=UPI0005C45C5D|nr:DNA translocase FtsK [Bacillus sp. EB01]